MSTLIDLTSGEEPEPGFSPVIGFSRLHPIEIESPPSADALTKRRRTSSSSTSSSRIQPPSPHDSFSSEWSAGPHTQSITSSFDSFPSNVSHAVLLSSSMAAGGASSFSITGSTRRNSVRSVHSSSSSSSSYNNTGVTRSNNSSDIAAPPVPRACKYFAAGRCSYGAQCRFLHSSGSSTSRSAPASSDRQLSVNAHASVHPPVSQFFSLPELFAIQAHADWSFLKHVLIIDLDNWQSFFSKLPEKLSPGVLVWVFVGGKCSPKISRRDVAVTDLLQRSCLRFSKCGLSKNAADFAIALEIGKLHEKLPAQTPITIVSGDSEFAELKAHMGNRQLTTLNPHHADPEIFFVQMRSISEI